jgi:hypothetical protein
MHVYGLMPLPLAIASLLALSGYLSLFIALAAWLTKRIGFDPTRAPNVLGAPVWAALIWAAAWTLSEWLRANLFTGFPWLSSGYAHVDSWFAPWASLLGVYGVSFITAFVAAVIAGLIMKDPTARGLSTVVRNSRCHRTDNRTTWLGSRENKLDKTSRLTNRLAPHTRQYRTRAQIYASSLARGDRAASKVGPNTNPNK